MKGTWVTHKTYSMDLDVVIDILGLDRQEQRSEPLERPKISANPEEVDLSQSSAGSLRVVHAVPDTLENGSERRDTNTGTTEYGDFELEYVLGGGTEGSVNVDAGEDLAQGNLLARSALLALLTAGFLFSVAAQGLAEGFGKVTNHTDVNGDVVFFRCASKCKGVVLPDRDFGAAQENVLYLLAGNP